MQTIVPDRVAKWPIPEQMATTINSRGALKSSAEQGYHRHHAPYRDWR
jgi:hypothetical protein